MNSPQKQQKILDVRSEFSLIEQNIETIRQREVDQKKKIEDIERQIEEIALKIKKMNVKVEKLVLVREE